MRGLGWDYGPDGPPAQANPGRGSEPDPTKPELDFDTTVGEALARLKTATLAVYGILRGGGFDEAEEETVYWCLWKAIEQVEREIAGIIKGPATREGEPTPGGSR
jgi:hypothetical protein